MKNRITSFLLVIIFMSFLIIIAFMFTICYLDVASRDGSALIGDYDNDFGSEESANVDYGGELNPGMVMVEGELQPAGTYK